MAATTKVIVTRSLQDPRLEELLAVILRLAAGDLGARGRPSTQGDEVDAIITGFNMLAEELSASMEALRHSETRYRDLVEHLPGIVYMADLGAAGAWHYVSPQVEPILGFSAGEWLADPQLWARQLHPDDRDRILACEEDSVNYPVGWQVAPLYRLFAHDGRLVWVRDQAVVVADEKGQARYWQGVMYDVTELRQVEEQLRASLAEKEVLLREIHHRVKNNLQVISSLLNLQAEGVKNPVVTQSLQEARRRVQAMALVHQKLYQSPSLARLDLADYLPGLVDSLLRSYSGVAETIHLTVEAAHVELNVDKAIPCGLIVTELVSNALKHAFPAGRTTQNEIRVTLQAAGDLVTLTVQDTGVGFPDGLDFRRTDSLGLQLVNLFVEQLGGTFDLYRNGGTHIKIAFRNNH